jgi:hypothetical protein
MRRAPAAIREARGGLHAHCRKNAMFRRLPSSLIGHNCRLGLSDGGGGFPLSASFMSLRNDGVVDHGER